MQSWGPGLAPPARHPRSSLQRRKALRPPPPAPACSPDVTVDYIIGLRPLQVTGYATTRPPPSSGCSPPPAPHHHLPRGLGSPGTLAIVQPPGVRPAARQAGGGVEGHRADPGSPSAPSQRLPAHLSQQSPKNPPSCSLSTQQTSGAPRDRWTGQGVPPRQDGSLGNMGAQEPQSPK